MAVQQKRQKLSKNDYKESDIVASAVQEAELNHSKASKAITKDPRTLFVRSLAAEVTDDDLAKHFSDRYPIKHAVAVLDKESKLCKGYGFVTFAELEDAQKAIKELNATQLHGKNIKVELAQARHRSDGDNGKSPIKAEHQKHSSPKLIIRNLPWTIDTREKLEHLFQSFGKVTHAILPKHSSGRLLGFGLVIIRGKKNADKALDHMNGKEVDGRTLAVDWAADKDTWEKVKQQELAAELASSKPTRAQTAKLSSQQDDAASDLSSDDNYASDKSEVPGDNSSPHPDTDMETDTEAEDESEKQPANATGPDRNPCTIFVRNLPFSCEDEQLGQQFEHFGPIRYSRVVFDPTTEQSRGCGFVCFVQQEDADRCVREAPRSLTSADVDDSRRKSNVHTVLQDQTLDPSGHYTLQGRILIITRAVDKDEATRLRDHGVQRRNQRDNDKRRLYLLNEGRLSVKSPVYQKLSASEIALRDASVKQRKKLVESNPSLHLSLTRLSVRNIPRSMTSKDFKALARQALVGFAQDVRSGKRQPLSKEELARASDEMKEAERIRKLKGVGVVKQAKIVYETKQGSKVDEPDGAGRSRGYGFIEYYTHRSALMGLRWLNGYLIQAQTSESGHKSAVEPKRRLIVEFALENVNVVLRRKERESRTPAKPREKTPGQQPNRHAAKSDIKARRNHRHNNNRADQADQTDQTGSAQAKQKKNLQDPEESNKIAKRARIITKKRQARKARKAA